MTDYLDAGFSQHTETRLDVVSQLDTTPVYGRTNQKPIASMLKAKVRKVAPPDTDIFKRTTYLCPELKQTCHRAGAYDAFELPSVIGNERKPYRFSQESTGEC